ncbi:MAG: ABC transporter ATP-binding protein [Anaerolineaceae bacterium]|jgi:NitT/TauT family transport system ATP-binding protein
MPSSSDYALQVRNLTVNFVEEDGSLEVLDGLSFAIPENQFVCLIGPSGGGKSTLLRVLAGLVTPTNGGFQLKGSGTSQLTTGLVFQQANLMPWRTLEANIRLPLDIANLPREEIDKRTREMIDLVGLGGFEHSFPHELSGGMAQRVAIARSLIQDPKLLLLDEPFGQLDALTREQMGAELLRIWTENKKTVLMVTHSITEAIFLADRVLVLTKRPGRLILDMPIPLARPRTEVMRYSPEFNRISIDLHNHLAQN